MSDLNSFGAEEEFWVKQLGSEDKRYLIFKVPLPEDFPDEEKETLYHLSKAVEAINPIYVNQIFPELPEFYNFLDSLKENANEDEVRKIENYQKSLLMHNKFFPGSNGKSVVLDIEDERLQEITPQEFLEDYNFFKPYLEGRMEYDGRGNFYPEGLEEEDLEEIDGAKDLNTRVIKTEDGYKALRNEGLFKDWINKMIIPHLRRASEATGDEKLSEYLRYKIKELETGEKEDRLEAHRKWLEIDSENEGKIDFILGLSDEVYMDRVAAKKGTAEGLVFIRNEKENEKFRRIRELLPEIEERNTYSDEFKKSPEDLKISSDLVAYDVLRWSGDCIDDGTLIGKSWPDEGNLGRKQMLLNNMFQFYPLKNILSLTMNEEEFESIEDKIDEAFKIYVNLHELGHSTGRDDIEYKGISEYYSTLEEARASLVAMNSIPLLKERGIVEDDEALYKVMLGKTIQRLSYEPVEDHIKEENLLFHWFGERGCIERGDGLKFKVDVEKTKENMGELLKLVGDILFNCDKEGAKNLIENYVYEDEIKDELQKKLKSTPRGRGFLFPRINEDGTIDYPKNLEEQNLPIISFSS